MNSNLSELLVFDQMVACLKTRERLSLIHNPLCKHEIDTNLRTRMVNWMIEVCSKFEFTSKVFFLSVKIMDKYLQCTHFKLTSNDIHVLGVTCMLISCKLEEIYRLSINVFVSNIARNKFLPTDVVDLEKKILQTLFFEVDLVVSLDFLTLICKMFQIPTIIEKTAENLLYIFQLLTDTQLLPSTEAFFALYFSCLTYNHHLSPEITLLIGGKDLTHKVQTLYNQLLCNQEHIKKYRNAQIFRKFEIDLNNSQVRVLNLQD